MILLIDLLVGLTYSSTIAYGAYKKHSLSRSGLAAAIILGTSIYVFGGLWASAIMVAFFVSSSVLTKFKKTLKSRTDSLNEKGGNRDSMQVLANGGIGLVLTVLFYIYKNPIFMIAYAASFAEATADTWASEIGVLSTKPPVSILNGKPLERGMSGGVSLLGSLFAMMGSLFITVIFAGGFIIKYGVDKHLFLYTALCFTAGFLGSIVDSLLGASFQAQYYCRELDSLTEKSHYSGVPNKLVKGFKFFNNDIVNLSSNLTSTLLLVLILSISS